MTVMLPRRSLVRPTQPTVNKGHWAARHLEFAYNGNATGRGVRGLVTPENVLMTQVGSAGVVRCADGLGVSGTAADTAYYSVARHPSSFAGDITMMWRGVMLGDAGTTNQGAFLAVNYGSGSGAPFEVFSIGRNAAFGQGTFQVASNDGTYRSSQTDISLASYYNRPMTIAVSNAAGSAVVTAYLWVHGLGAFRAFLNNLGAASGNPRSTSATDRIIIGTNYGAGRFTNAVTTAAAIWSRAFDERQLRDVVANSADIFAPSRVSISLVPTVASTAPEITVTGNGNAITDGDGTPSATDHTDFGTTPEGTTKSRTFTIANDGDANLTISSVALSGTGAGEFTITTGPTGTIAPAGTGTLTVRADATTQGTFSATVTINSNDSNEAAFDFAIAVEVTEPAAEGAGGGGVLFGTLGSISMSPRRRRLRSKGKGYF